MRYELCASYCAAWAVRDAAAVPCLKDPPRALSRPKNSSSPIDAAAAINARVRRGRFVPFSLPLFSWIQ